MYMSLLQLFNLVLIRRGWGVRNEMNQYIGTDEAGLKSKREREREGDVYSSLSCKSTIWVKDRVL